MTMTRKQFLGTVMGAAGAALLAGCGGDDGGHLDGSTQRNCAMNGTTTMIANNHGHVIVVTSADVTAGADKTYDIMGTADHTHSVTITAADFAKLQSNANGTVMELSTVGSAHTHEITVICA